MPGFIPGYRFEETSRGDRQPVTEPFTLVYEIPARRLYLFRG